MHKKAAYFLFLSLMVGLILAACAPGQSFSAEQTALNSAMQSFNERGSVIDRNSITVHQKQEMRGNQYYLISFSRRVENRNEDCMVVWEVQPRMGMWTPAGGGGGCSGVVQVDGVPAAEPEPAIEQGGGSSGGSSPNDPGVTYDYGLVNQDDIAKVRVTWEDGSTQEAEVVNDSYMVIRTGSLAMGMVEGLNDKGEVVFSSAPQVAPGKVP